MPGEKEEFETTNGGDPNPKNGPVVNSIGWRKKTFGQGRMPQTKTQGACQKTGTKVDATQRTSGGN